LNVWLTTQPKACLTVPLSARGRVRTDEEYRIIKGEVDVIERIGRPTRRENRRRGLKE